MSETRLANQSTVEFCGLQGRADLNGKRGLVKGFVAEKDRYAVVVDEWPAREQAPVLIKRANLRFIAEPGSAGRFHAANKEEAERDSINKRKGERGEQSWSQQWAVRSEDER